MEEVDKGNPPISIRIKRDVAQKWRSIAARLGSKDIGYVRKFAKRAYPLVSSFSDSS
jgi:hypothetical protein